MADPISSGLIPMVGKEMISNIANDLYTYLKGKVTLKIKQSEIVEKLPGLVNRINNVRFVKTLWQVDQAVDIESFYCDSNVIISDGNKENQIRRKIDTVLDFGIQRNIVIRGIAGQGKSIFLRHLCVKESEMGKRIPVFIELRRIQDNETLLEHISRYFDILELQIDRVLFQILAKSGKLIFFLDGFDEISEEKITKIINELEYLASVTPECQFIITSRPNTPIEMSSLFNVVRLDDLQGNEYKTVIQRLTNSPEYANALVKKIKTNKSNMMAMLCTPLLVTLLVLSYKSYQKLPEQLSDFYETIFLVLLQRHDGTKPGFIRKRGCLINDSQYRDVFDALCFQTKKLKGLMVDYKTIYGNVEAAMKLINIQEDPDKYLKDIINITCLILHEGGEYRFIHNSVQEYFAASFIKDRPDEVVKRFYNACLKDEKAANQWNQELEYLSNIDKYRYSKYYHIPLMQKWMDCDDVDILRLGSPPLTKNRMKALFVSIDVTFVIGQTDHPSYKNHTAANKIVPVSSMYKSHSPMGFYPNRFEFTNIYNFDFDALFIKKSKGDMVIDKSLLAFPEEIIRVDSDIEYNVEKFKISLQQIVDEDIRIDKLKTLAEKVLFHLYSSWKSAYDYVSLQESLDVTSFLST